MKKLFFTFLILTVSVYPQQIGFVQANNSIYIFLERMERLDVISDYNSFEIPKTRNEITRCLKEINLNSHKLNKPDLERLKLYLREYELDISGTSEGYQSFINEFKIKKLFNEKEKFIFYKVDEHYNSIFINVEADAEMIGKFDYQKEENISTSIFTFGASLHGTVAKKIGYYIKATNGTYLDNKDLTFEREGLNLNYKYTQEPENSSGADYFDETVGYIAADFDFINFRLGRGKNIFGYGKEKSILSYHAPVLDFIQLNAKYSIIKFSFFHAKLLGQQSRIKYENDAGFIAKVKEKYLGYHRLELNFSKHLRFGLGEMVVYGDRGIDLSYLNPFSFYKSLEHANQDRDNAMLFLDLKNKSIKGLELYFTFIIDDIDFNQLGSGWFGNKLAYNLGFKSSNLYNIIPLDISFQYIRNEPYVYSHRILNNNYTSQSVSLVEPIMPNSEVYNINFEYSPFRFLFVNVGFTYTTHGANIYDEKGKLQVNYGGNILEGHRSCDSQKAEFLSGKKEIFRTLNLAVAYEPINGYNINLELIYRNFNLSGNVKRDELISKLKLSLKI